MTTMLPIALTCFLFITSLTASFPYAVHARDLPIPLPLRLRVPVSELRTGVSYFMIPQNLGLCRLAPRLNLICPYAIGDASFDMVPVTFSLPDGQDGDGKVPLEKPLRISFNVSNVSLTWGRSDPIPNPLPSVEPICLGCIPHDFYIHPASFVYTFREVEGRPGAMDPMNIVVDFDPWARGGRLAIAKKPPLAEFHFYEAEGYYHQGIKSVA